MNKPVDKKLYERIKKEIFSKNPINSAYRSGLLVKTYKEKFRKKYGNKSAYTGNKSKAPLTRWYREEWKNQRGGIGYKEKGDIYRPTKRITKDTPKTFSELSKREIEIAKNKKKKKGRVDKF